LIPKRSEVVLDVSALLTLLTDTVRLRRATPHVVMLFDILPFESIHLYRGR
jgi:hypothetical protein